ncbi:ATP-dependent Zn protease [Consotaella aegiceratis]|uniref:ATP-dependent Zn protease n=1 Tax=Consotaella aegiceratis TaxID=3097961 RepID=UPI002F406F44
MTPYPSTALDTLARQAVGMSGADIERLVREARGKARREHRSLTYVDLETALARSKPRRSADLRYHIAVHEAGHAILRHVLNLGSILALSVVDEGGGSAIAEESAAVQTEGRLMALLAVYLGGRAAEELVFGEVSAASGGPENSDLARGTRLALAIEMCFGLGADRPLVHRNLDLAEHMLLRDGALLDRVNARLEAAQQQARITVAANLDLLLRLADALTEAGTLDADEITAILGGDQTVAPALPSG